TAEPDTPSAPGSAGSVPRRTVLRNTCLFTAAGAALTAVGATTAGCTLGLSDDGPDPLTPLAEAAESDAAKAGRLAAADPERAVALNTVADERRAHAAALRKEIARVAGTAESSDAATGTATSAAGSGPAGSPAPSAPPTLDEVRAALA